LRLLDQALDGWTVGRELMTSGETEIRDASHSRKGDVRRDQI